MTLYYDHIDSILKEKGMSRRQLAKLIDVSPNTLTSAFVRHSKKTFSIEKANKISEILDVPLIDIADLEIEPVELCPSKDDPEFAAKQELAKKFLAGLRKRRREEQFETLKVYFDLLNDKGRDKAIEMMAMLYRIPDYKLTEAEGDE